MSPCLKPLDADLLLVDRERRLVLADDRDERREVGALGQGLGELEAGARAGRVGVHAEIGDAEAVFLAQRRILRLKLGRGMQGERELQRIQRRAPLLPLGEGAGERDERGRLLVRRGRALIGDIGRGACPLDARRAVVLFGGRDQQPEIGEPAPGGGVVRLDRDDLHIDVGGAGEVLALDEPIGLLPQLDERLLDGAGLVLEVGFERGRRVVERLVLESLLCGGGRGGRENEQRGKHAGAKPSGH